MSLRRILTSFNLLSRRVLGSLGPISPGRAAVTGGSTYAVLSYGAPKFMTWIGRSVPSMQIMIGTAVATAVVVEGVCYIWGTDPDVHAEAVVATARATAQDYLASPEREAALVRASGQHPDEIRALLRAMLEARSAPAEVVEEVRATA